MSYKISEKSNQNGVIELLLQPIQSHSPWLNVQIDQRNPTNRVVRVKTVDEKSYIVLTPFLNSHKEVNAAVVEAELTQFIASQNYGIALRDRKIIFLGTQEFKVPAVPQRKQFFSTPKHMMGVTFKKTDVPGGDVFKKEMSDKRESEDAGLMAYGSAKRAKVVQMFEDMAIVPTQPGTKMIPKLAAKSRLLQQPVVAEPQVARPVSPVLQKVVSFTDFQDVLPIIEEDDGDLSLAIAMSLKSSSVEMPPVPVLKKSPEVRPEPVQGVDEDLDFAIALSLQGTMGKAEVPSRKRCASPSPAPSPYPAPSPAPAPSPYPAPFGKRMPQSLSRIDSDAALAARLAKEMEEEDRKLTKSQEEQDAYMMKLLGGFTQEDQFAKQKRLQREEQDRRFAAQLEAEERQRLQGDQELLNRKAIEALQAQDALEAGDLPMPIFAEDYPVESFEPQDHGREGLCQIHNVDVDLLNQFEDLALPALDTDAHVANKNFVRNSRFLVDALFELNNDIMDLYSASTKVASVTALLTWLMDQPEYAPNTPYNRAVQNVFGPYATKDKEADETGGVSLQDMIMRIYVLLIKNADIERKAIYETRAFKFLKEQMTDQASTCFEGAIARMFCAYWAGLRYFYDNLVGSRKKG